MTRIERAQSEVYRSAECQRDEPRTPSGTNGTDGFGRRTPSCKDGLLARASSHGHRRPHASMHDIFRWRHPECLREGAQKVQSAIAIRLRQVFQGSLPPIVSAMRSFVFRIETFGRTLVRSAPACETWCCATLDASVSEISAQ